MEMTEKATLEEQKIQAEVMKRIGAKYTEVLAHIAKISIAAEIVETEVKFLEDNKKYVNANLNNKIKTMNRNIDSFLKSMKNKLSKEQKETLDQAVEVYYDVVSNIIALKFEDLMEVNELIVEKAKDYCKVVNMD